MSTPYHKELLRRDAERPMRELRRRAMMIESRHHGDELMDEIANVRAIEQAAHARQEQRERAIKLRQHALKHESVQMGDDLLRDIDAYRTYGKKSRKAKKSKKSRKAKKSKKSKKSMKKW